MTTPRLLSNRYELGDTLGYGGMSEVHKGRDVRLGRDVAVKVLRQDLARDPQFQERFRREAQNAAALNHPAIVAVYDTGETRTEHGPLPYIVMEYVDGRTLRDIVKTEGPLPGQRAMEIMADVSAALDFSHRHGIIHRDVKPANVMITKTGAVKVMDFGIARAIHDGQAAVTQTAAVIGTAQYLSPEQARGEQVDARSDVYAAGCVLFELLTGEPPFTGDSPVAVAYQHVREDPKPPSALNPRVNPALDAIVLKAMAKGAPNRYQSAAEMRTDLVRVLSGQRPLAPMVMTDEDRTTILSQGRTTAMPPQRGRHRPAALAEDPDDYDPYEDDEEERRRKRRKGWLIALLTVLGVALIAVLIWLMSTAFGDEPASEQVTVPDVVSQTEIDAREELQGRGFEVRIDEVFCQPTPTSEPGQCGPDSIGKVVETNPAPGTKVSKSSVVVLRVGREAPKKTVPELSGKTPDEARAELEKAGLTLDPTTTEEEVDDESLVGKVVAQDPPSGTQAAQNAPVKITIGKAKEQSSVPNLIGQDFETAKGNLESLGFTVKREEQSSDKPANQVIDQNPKGGEHEPGTEITLVVSKGDQQNDKISMPSLIGLTEQDAEQLLRQQGWTGSFDTEETDTQNPAEFDRILDQEQGAGSQIDKDQDVGIIVGKPGIGGGR
ncbi:Stk1 family PASTA domain-containing Ser/Thr kinase [Actinophytocola algeriensis]|uniref:non-specific serine/threonine protein kinase n=1 Tax=Actinophytocola algeriensis TaxID=1768010 RepID=A0A7W7Q4S9_9PSEU|nr:Stk1 family PASTA domain-containing Ser/Thr kinase [Actinophytocola algeriensis]MBB4906731.1 serine/threonine-protein kinase [Actinophytocola algeriensis]MBE1478212.1 serine/threonine-protein kinase [Actinophytocola algeriensis]